MPVNALSFLEIDSSHILLLYENVNRANFPSYKLQFFSDRPVFRSAISNQEPCIDLDPQQ